MWAGQRRREEKELRQGRALAVHDLRNHLCSYTLKRELDSSSSSSFKIDGTWEEVSLGGCWGQAFRGQRDGVGVGTGHKEGGKKMYIHFKEGKNY